MTAPALRLRPDLDLLPAYRPGKRRDASNAARSLGPIAALAANEMPHGPLPSVAAAIAAAQAELNRYPDPYAAGLRDALAQAVGTPVEHVAAGPGSINLCHLAVTVAVERGSEVVFPWPSFEGYPLLAAVAGASPVPVALSGDAIDPDRIVHAVTDRTRVVFVCNPNNPTGTVLDREEIDALIRRLPRDRLVVVDEAYAEFADSRTHAIGLVEDHANLLVTRTFSKAYGLAGLRVGYAVGHPELVSAVMRAQLPFVIATPAIEGARAALAAHDELAQRVAAVTEHRNAVEAAARALGLPVAASHGNFVWLSVGEAAGSLAEQLETDGVLARPVPPHGVRITVGDEDDTDLVLRALRRIR
jgi:histidinol-phosphate aminotransferase